MQFPDVENGRWQVSTGGGTVPLWARDGGELFYRSGASLMVAKVQTTGGFSAATPTKLFEGYATGLGRMYDVSPDGQQFLMIKDSLLPVSGAPALPSLVVVTNWVEELKTRVPTSALLAQ